MQLKKRIYSSFISVALICSCMTAQANNHLSKQLAAIEAKRIVNETIVQMESNLAEKQELLTALNVVLKTAEAKKYAKNVSLDSAESASPLAVSLFFTELSVFVASSVVWKGIENYNAQQLIKNAKLFETAKELAAEASLIFQSPYSIVGGGSQYLEVAVNPSLIPKAMKDINNLLVRYNSKELKAAAVFINNGHLLPAINSGKGFSWQSKNEFSKAVSKYRKVIYTGRIANATMALAMIAVIPTTMLYFNANDDLQEVPISAGLTVRQAIAELDDLVKTEKFDLLQQKIDGYALHAIKLSVSIIEDVSEIETLKK